MTLEVRTEQLDEDTPLLALLGGLPDTARTAFVREGEGIVAAGTAVDIPVPSGPQRLRSARQALDRVVDDAHVEDPLGLPGSGLIAVGSFTFDPRPRDRGGSEVASVLRVPRHVIGRRDGVTWRTTIARVDGSEEESDDHSRGPDQAVGPVATSDRPRYAGSTLDDADWLEAVARALARIDAGDIEKVVLARDVHLWSRTPFVLPDVLEALAGRFPSCFTFLVDGLVGASPELLLRRRADAVTSRVLAGTARRGAGPEEDERLGSLLLASDKDRREHDIAARSVIDTLAGFCADVVAPDGPSLVRLDNVQHLGSDVTGTLAAPHHVLDILDALHPTAAVCGTPREAALGAIGELERMDRGRYAGPVGWCDASGDGEFAIALRCAEIRGDRARLLAGAGIVGGSLPEEELVETWLKLRAMTDVLTRP